MELAGSLRCFFYTNLMRVLQNPVLQQIQLNTHLFLFFPAGAERDCDGSLDVTSLSWNAKHWTMCQAQFTHVTGLTSSDEPVPACSLWRFVCSLPSTVPVQTHRLDPF